MTPLTTLLFTKLAEQAPVSASWQQKSTRGHQASVMRRLWAAFWRQYFCQTLYVDLTIWFACKRVDSGSFAAKQPQTNCKPIRK
jgi:hypothetical protein